MIHWEWMFVTLNSLSICLVQLHDIPSSSQSHCHSFLHFPLLFSHSSVLSVLLSLSSMCPPFSSPFLPTIPSIGPFPLLPSIFFQVLLMNKQIDPAELDFLLRFPAIPNVVSPVDFLSNHCWGGIKALSNMEQFRNLDRDIEVCATWIDNPPADVIPAS